MTSTPEIMAARQPPQLLAALPTEVTKEITGHLAVTSERPMDDFRSLRVTCSFMDDMSWNELARYTALLTRLTLISNPDTYFFTGIVEFFGEHHDPQPSFHELSCAAMGGHNVAAYLVTLILYKNNGGTSNNDTVRWYIRWIEGEEHSMASDSDGPRMLSNKGCRLCHEQAAFWIGRTIWRKAGEPLPQAPVRGDPSCANSGCGVTFECPQKTLFCSEDCKIHREIVVFQRKLGIDK
uniref:F-box domain-containing protein n=1 Tax=Setaria italica TaxID=4555 RepID=K3YLK4_SETIT